MSDKTIKEEAQGYRRETDRLYKEAIGEISTARGNASLKTTRGLGATKTGKQYHSPS